MFYSYALTIPAGTTQASPVELRCKMSEGIVHLVDVEFRSGTDFTTGIQIFQGGHQVYPTNPDGELKADGRPIIFPDSLPLSSGANELVVKGYAPNATYAHVVYIKFGVLRPDELRPVTSVDTLLIKFLRLVGIVK